MSTINTNGLNVNYPVPGENNSSQGFRNNFTNIKTNLDTAGNEITDLQNNVVLKSALANSTINNDMANTLISNASTLGFRATTYNLGNALSGTVIVNCTLGDVQYGNVAGNIVLQFGNWAPTGTQSKLQLQLGRANADVNYTISLPSEAIVDDNHGWVLLENYSYPNNVSTLTFPHDVTQVNFTLTSNDCGNTIFVEPTNRPFKSTQVQLRTPPSTGQLGDVAGTICIEANCIPQLSVSTLANDFLVTSNTSSLYLGLPVVFTASNATVSTEANITLGTTYYISNIANATSFKVSSTTSLASNVDLAGNANVMNMNSINYLYFSIADYNATANSVNIESTTSPNIITVQTGSVASANLRVNQPIIFTGEENSNLGITVGKPYYIVNAWNGNNNITVSETRYNGVAGPEVNVNTVANANVDVDFTAYNGTDIFRRASFNPF